MRFLKVLVLAPLVVLAACDQKKSDNAGSTGVTGAAYDMSADANKRFLADYAARPDVKKLPDGLMYRVLKSGNGPQVKSDGDMVTVTYKGSLITGKVFDQTKEGEPAQFPAGGLIPGWVEALKLMKTGDTWELVIPSELGYGSDGAGDAIPPDQTLVFTMTLVKVDPAP
ncbi:MAG TPA: FKBP-type peptidyl-prolyl cis-trans isomerase [Rhizomicrobium sp.]|nr:FKBP-type peptidyl-prolyl cis-trans isomerase [Rhizomicrobium sp.]